MSDPGPDVLRRTSSSSSSSSSERGSISLFILGLALVAMLLIAGAVAVTSAHLSRMRLLDVADGAALSAANALDDSAYDQGIGASVPLSNRSVQERAAVYLDSRPRPGSVTAWRLAPGTGTPDGRTAGLPDRGNVVKPGWRRADLEPSP